MRFPKQRGQALPLGIGMAAIGCALLLAYVNNAHVAIDKMRLSNAADAAAYSAMQWQARALNFQAYTNRAMVANQVAMAQAVSLRAWSLYGVVASENAHATIGNVPVVNTVTGAIETAMTAASRVVEPVAESIAGVVDTVNGALSDAQQAMYVSALAATPETVRQVVEASDERFTADTAYTVTSVGSAMRSIPDFTTRTSDASAPAMRGRADMINRSLDPFSREREWRFFNFWLPTSPFTWVRLQRQGTTRLVSSDEGAGGTAFEWKAKDGLSLATQVWRPIRGFKQVELPVGWGEALFNADASLSSIEPRDCRQIGVQGVRVEHCGNRWLGAIPRAESYADLGMPSVKGSVSREAISARYHGLRPFRGLSDATLESDTPSMLLAVEVALPSEDAIDTDARVSGRFVGENREVAAYSSLAMAEVYYRHPQGDAADAAFANSYSPYWDVRLVRVPEEQRAAIAALRLSELSSGGGSSAAPQWRPGEPLLDAGLTVAGDSVGNGSLNSIVDSVADSTGTETFPSLSAYVEQGTATVQALGSVVDDTQAVLEDAATSLLTGLVESRTGVSIEALTDGDTLVAAGEAMVDDVLSQAGVSMDELEASLASTCESALSEALRLREEFARVRDAVASDYATAREEVEQAITEELAGLQARIDTLREDLEQRAMSDDEQHTVQQRIGELSIGMESVSGSLAERLAERLVEIVTTATDVYPMTQAFALSVVEADLAYEQDVADALGVSDVLDDAAAGWHCG